jgi:hypothetical protein
MMFRDLKSIMHEYFDTSDYLFIYYYIVHEKHKK